MRAYWTLVRRELAQNLGMDSGSRRAKPLRAAVHQISADPRADPDAARRFSADGRRVEGILEGRFYASRRAESVFLAGPGGGDCSGPLGGGGHSVRLVA